MGLEGIGSLEKHGVRAYDKAVWLLTKGIYHEIFQEYALATECYKKAIKKYAGTYSAYFKLANIACGLGGFDVAETFCTQGLSYLKKDKLYDQNTLKEIEIRRKSECAEL
jgi:tetratricopeptide (TPR) repeat protein